MDIGVYVGLNVHKDSIAVGQALPGREDPVSLGVIANDGLSVPRLLNRMSSDGTAPSFCYLTGCRKRKILHLRWEQVDLEAAEFVLPDTKTGPRKVSLSPRAARVLKSMPRMTDNPWVIPGRVGGRPMRNIDESW